MTGNQASQTPDGRKSKNNMSTPQWGGHNYFILGDDAFPLKLWLMKPYSSRGTDLNQRVFNYRLSWGKGW